MNNDKKNYIIYHNNICYYILIRHIKDCGIKLAIQKHKVFWLWMKDCYGMLRVWIRESMYAFIL